MAIPHDVQHHPELEPNKFYIIDFDSARHFPLGPGVQPAITLPETQRDPPNGLKHFDPYSWDVYCIGYVCKQISEVPCEFGRDRRQALTRLPHV